MTDTVKKPYKYLVWAKYGTRPAETPDLAWDLAYAGNNELDAISKYAELKRADENNEVIFTKQTIVVVHEVEI